MFSWVRIYSSSDYDEVVRMENLLEEHGIFAKTKIKNVRERMADNVILGGNPIVLNAHGINSPYREYQILVRREYAEEALF